MRTSSSAHTLLAQQARPILQPVVREAKPLAVPAATVTYGEGLASKHV